MFEARRWIERLALQPHPEGGYYREVYRSPEQLSAAALPPRFGGPRSFGTHIYYLLMEGQYSAFHRIRSDELWHHYDGQALEVHVLDRAGHRVIELSRDTPFGVVAAGDWFGAQLGADGGYALCGCTVAPGFDFEDFEMAERARLAEAFPGHRDLIARLTRG